MEEEDYKPLIFIGPLSSTLQKLKEAIEKSAIEEKIDVIDAPGVEEASQLIPQLGQSVVIASHPKNCALTMQKTYRFIKSFGTKIILLSPKEFPKKTVDKLMKLGLTELMVEPVPPKTLQYKVNFMLRSILAKKRSGQLKRKEVKLEDNLQEVLNQIRDKKEHQIKSVEDEISDNKKVKTSFNENISDINKIKTSTEKNENIIEKENFHKGRSSFNEEALTDINKAKSKAAQTELELKDEKSQSSFQEQFSSLLKKESNSSYKEEDLYTNKKYDSQYKEENIDSTEKKESNFFESFDEQMQSGKSFYEEDYTSNKPQKNEYEQVYENDYEKAKSNYQEDTDDYDKIESYDEYYIDSSKEKKKENTLYESYEETNKKDRPSYEEDDFVSNQSSKSNYQEKISNTETAKSSYTEDIGDSLRKKKSEDPEDIYEDNKKKNSNSIEDIHKLDQQKNIDLYQNELEETSRKKNRSYTEELKDKETHQSSYLEDNEDLKRKNIDLYDNLNETTTKQKPDNYKEVHEDKKKKSNYQEEDIFNNKKGSSNYSEERDEKNKRNFDYTNEVFEKSNTNNHEDIDDEIKNKKQDEFEEYDEFDSYKDKKEKKLKEENEQEWEDIDFSSRKDDDKKTKLKEIDEIVIPKSIKNGDETIEYDKFKTQFANIDIDHSSKNIKNDFDFSGEEKEKLEGKKREDLQEEGLEKEQNDSSLKEEDKQIESDIIYLPKPKHIEKSIKIINMYQNKSIKEDEIIKYICNVIYENFKGFPFVIFNAGISKISNELFNGYAEFGNEEQKEDEFLKKFRENNFERWKSKNIPSWKDHKFQEEENEFIYPFFEGIQSMGQIAILFNEKVSEDDSHSVELFCSMLRGIFIERNREVGQSGDYESEGSEKKPKTESKILRFFKKVIKKIAS